MPRMSLSSRHTASPPYTEIRVRPVANHYRGKRPVNSQISGPSADLAQEPQRRAGGGITSSPQFDSVPKQAIHLLKVVRRDAAGRKTYGAGAERGQLGSNPGVME